jgi:hypothetical protein
VKTYIALCSQKFITFPSLMPSFPSPLCRVCSSHNESLIHFLFLCPVKHLVWQNIIQEFLWPTCEANDIIQPLKTMDYSNIIYCKLPKIYSRSIIYITLAEIWNAYYRLVFQDSPLVLFQVKISGWKVSLLSPYFLICPIPITSYDIHLNLFSHF